MADLAVAIACKYLHATVSTVSRQRRVRHQDGSVGLIEEFPILDPSNRDGQKARRLVAMFNTAKMIYANLGLATIIRNKLVKANPDAQYELTKTPLGVQIVRKEPEPVAAPLADEDVFFAVMPVRSIKTKQVWFWDNGKAACIDGKNLLGYNLGDDDKVTIKVPLAYAKRRGWTK
jgi:hypothetical protein